ncbi:MAG: tetratricopeptide repeat protein [Candidatus Methylacidiphilales bacterium]|nr:tetratricopeptide repeat protein [Candidatus Methylacidiphilales bacterium]
MKPSILNLTSLILGLLLADTQAQTQTPEKQMWEDPTFVKSFIGSFGVDPGKEPSLTEEDRLTLTTLQQMLRDDRASGMTELEGYVDDKTNARFDLILANLYLETSNLPKAEEFYLKAIRKFPNFRAAYRNLALIMAQQQRFQDAARYLVKTLEFGEADPSVYGMLARCHLGAGDVVAAESAFRQAVLLQPNSKEWRQGLLVSLVRQKKLADAAAAIDEMVVRDPENAALLQQQSQIFMASGNLTKAAETLEMVARRGAAKTGDLYQLGDIYVSAKLPLSAASAYKRAIASDSALGEKALRAVEVLVAYNNPVEAGQLLDLLQTKIASGPLKARMLRVRARLALQSGANAEAAVILRQVVEEDPLDGQGWMLLGKNHQETGETDKALFAYERAASIEATAADAKIRMGQIYAGKKDYSKAVSLLEDAQKIAPKDSVARYLEQIRALARSKGGGI